ncbi:conserved hypothetical protein (plasmid) [Pseudarthrobacter chlorophenolicus A6]|uniref:DUF4031 domain-containing protein n=1 Tax=Pseudarthrobacter chlorophenolicus (strain ATCC 700700 / DSM 12829 / CIP 107037 / JCM 12360 / KCTC 9906 / NCIMB 13794 / A6) TaxID=452863 RepID=B8HII1_PSECP|nr:DUF4031 domain-containing protein [Pseudarthrobacter chlorophenolicus]ACL42228.1 conserved hypothetical protein [Pseudarthrobacter chlorophenolicus A6]SDQ15175.1 Protein of unknown function [Pseudarthrobacter chlorophenolicus]
MTVYVDSMRMPARVGRIQARWSHLTADSTEELLDFAAKLGLKPSWIQNPGHIWKEHFDVTDSKRELAIRLGAQPITMQEACTLWAAKREAARPATAVAPHT